MYLTPVAATICSMAVWPLELTPAVATETAPGLAFIASSRPFMSLCGELTGTLTIVGSARCRYRCQSRMVVSTMPRTL